MITEEENTRLKIKIQREQWRRDAALRIYCASIQAPLLDRIIAGNGSQVSLAQSAVLGASSLLKELDETYGR